MKEVKKSGAGSPGFKKGPMKSSSSVKSLKDIMKKAYKSAEQQHKQEDNKGGKKRKFEGTDGGDKDGKKNKTFHSKPFNKEFKGGKEGGFKGKEGGFKKPFNKDFKGGKEGGFKKPFNKDFKGKEGGFKGKEGGFKGKEGGFKKPFNKDFKGKEGGFKGKEGGFKGKEGFKSKDGFKKKFDDKKSGGKSAATPINYKANKPHFKLVENIKTNWNKVREHATEDPTREKLVADMVKNIKTHVLDITLRHDASRMVQTILQFGNEKQKELVLVELLEKLFEIAKTPYGHFAVLKAITYCNQPALMKKITVALQKHFVSLGTHVIGARTVESVMQLYPPAITRQLKAEFYGKNMMILLSETPKNLREIMEQLPNKRTSILDHMRDLISKLVSKQLLEFTYVHHLLLEYTQELQILLDESKAQQIEEIDMKKVQQRIDDLIGQLADSAPKLLSTKPGAKAMCFVITHSSAKDRKRIIKSLKGHCLESLCHDSAFLGIMRLVDVTDDTVNIQKSFFDELKTTDTAIKYTASGEIKNRQEPPWLSIAKHPNASKLLLRLLAPTKRHLEPDEEGIFSVPSVHSKKDADLRRKEHVTFLRQVLVKLFSQYAGELVRSRSGTKVLEAMVQVYHPAGLISNIAKVFGGATIEAVQEEEEDVVEEEEDDEEEEEGDDEDEEGEEDFEAEEEEDVEVMDDEYEEEEGDGEEADDDEDIEEVEGDEEYDEQLKEAMEDMKEATKKNSGGGKKKVEEVEVALLPIEEDSIAHLFLKRLLRWEGLIESKDLQADAQFADVLSALKEYDETREKEGVQKDDLHKVVDQVDRSLWSTEEAEQGFGQQLLNYLVDNEFALLKKWSGCNRACFALHDLFRIPSLLMQFQSLLSNVSEASLQQTEGGKVLFRLQQVIDNVQSKKEDKKKKAATPAKATKAAAASKTPAKTPAAKTPKKK